MKPTIKDQQEAAAFYMERLKRHYEQPATKECLDNREHIRKCFLQYREDWNNIMGVQYDYVEAEVMAREGVPFRTIAYIEEKGLDIINSLPLKATEGILQSERLPIYDYYKKADKHEYCIAASIIEVLRMGKSRYTPYLQELKEKAIERARAELQAGKATETAVQKAIEYENNSLERFQSFATLDEAYRFFIGVRWIHIDDDEQEEAFKKETLEIIANINKPSTYSILNNKISNEYFGIQEDLLSTEPNGQLTFINNLIPVTQSSKTSKKKTAEVTTLVGLSYNGDLSRSLARVTGYDKAVLNAICSIYQAGSSSMTLSDVFRVMNGGNATKRPTAKQKDKLLAAIKKLGSTRIYIDMSQEIKQSYLTINDSRVIKGAVDAPLLQYTGGMFQTENGMEVYAINVVQEPILMTYSKAKNQLVSFPINLLDTKSVSATDEIIAIKEYMLQQITLMKKGQRDSKTILYKSIYKKCGLEEPSNRTVAKRDKDSIKKLLDEWKSLDYIKGYSEKTEGKSLVGVIIRL